MFAKEISWSPICRPASSAGEAAETSSITAKGLLTGAAVDVIDVADCAAGCAGTAKLLLASVVLHRFAASTAGAFRTSACNSCMSCSIWLVNCLWSFVKTALTQYKYNNESKMRHNRQGA